MNWHDTFAHTPVRRTFVVRYVQRNLCEAITWGKRNEISFLSFFCRRVLVLFGRRHCYRCWTIRILDETFSDWFFYCSFGFFIDDLIFVLFLYSKHARRHPNFDLSTLRQRKPANGQVSVAAIKSNSLSKLTMSNSLGSSESPSDNTSSDSTLTPWFLMMTKLSLFSFYFLSIWQPEKSLLTREENIFWLVFRLFSSEN